MPSTQCFGNQNADSGQTVDSSETERFSQNGVDNISGDAEKRQHQACACPPHYSPNWFSSFCNEMSSANASPDEAEVKRVLLTIRDEMQDTAAVKPLIALLGKVSNPYYTMGMLAPSIFLGEAGEPMKMSRQDALSAVMLLASIDRATYLKPASRAIKSYAELLNKSTTEQPIQVTDELLTVLVAQLSGTDVEVSVNATATIIATCRKLGSPLADRATRAIADSWRQAWNRTNNRQEATTICVRCASAVVDLACLGDAEMESAIKSGCTELLVAMMTDASDPLLQMSAMDLVEKLATTLPMSGTRAKWLFSHSVLHPLLEMAGADGDADPILGGPALRVLSTLCQLAHRDPALFGLGGSELLKGFHHALRNFNASGELDRLALVDAISSFASASPDALEIVLDDAEIRESWLSLNVAQPKLKSAILMSMALVIDPAPVKDANGDSVAVVVPSSALAMRLYSSLGLVNGRDATEIVMSLAKSPLIEERLGAYALLEAVAKQGTGAQVLLTQAGFFDFLVDRDHESTKEGKEAKFAIVQAILNSSARGLLADEIVNQLETIKKQGPYFVKTQPWEVSTAE